MTYSAGVRVALEPAVAPAVRALRRRVRVAEIAVPACPDAARLPVVGHAELHVGERVRLPSATTAVSIEHQSMEERDHAHPVDMDGVALPAFRSVKS